MSISSTSSSIIVAPCQQPGGKWSTSPGEATRSSPSTKKRTRPRTTMDICSCGCECSGVTSNGAKRKRQIIRPSPTTICRSMPSDGRSTGTVDQLTCCHPPSADAAAPPLSFCSLLTVSMFALFDRVYISALRHEVARRERARREARLADGALEPVYAILAHADGGAPLPERPDRERARKLPA